MSELKTKLHRAHSLTKQLERQLEDKNTQLLNLVQENRLIKTNLENDKQRVGSEFPWSCCINILLDIEYGYKKTANCLPHHSIFLLFPLTKVDMIFIAWDCHRMFCPKPVRRNRSNGVSNVWFWTYWHSQVTYHMIFQEGSFHRSLANF